MKSHKFWAVASCVCMTMALYTGWALTGKHRKG